MQKNEIGHTGNCGPNFNADVNYLSYICYNKVRYLLDAIKIKWKKCLAKITLILYWSLLCLNREDQGQALC